MADFAKVAHDLINKTFANESRSAIFVKLGEAVFDVATGAVQSSETTYKIKAAFVEYSMRQRELEGIPAGDRKCLLPAKGLKFVPQTGDLIRENSETWKVIVADTDATGKALYTLQLRREL